MTVHTSSGEDLARYPGQDTLLFYSANDEWRKILFVCFVKPPYFFFFLQHTTWSHTLCTDAKETEEPSQFIIGKDEFAVTTARVQKLHLFLLLQKCLGKYCPLYRHK